MEPINPFTPSFGEVPFIMAGRGQFIDEFKRALDRPTRSPELTTLVSGARGTGKTALLAYLSEEAAEHGWISANVTAAPGMLDDILAQTVRAAGKIAAIGDVPKLTGLGVGGMMSLEWIPGEAEPATWRSRMTDVMEALEPYGTGILITVDEVQPKAEELVQLSAIYQHFVRERRRVALVMAGLPFGISTLLRDKTVSFLRRAQRLNIGRIPDFEVADALRKTVESGGRSIGDEALKLSVGAIDGFPFMLQLAGYRMWNEHPDAPAISADDAKRGVALARAEMRERVIEPTYRELSDGDIAFLAAMLPDEHGSTMDDIARRMGKTRGYANTYRRRMMESGIIGEHGRGTFGFDLPAFREFLAEKLEGQPVP